MSSSPNITNTPPASTRNPAHGRTYNLATFAWTFMSIIALILLVAYLVLWVHPMMQDRRARHAARRRRIEAVREVDGGVGVELTVLPRAHLRGDMRPSGWRAPEECVLLLKWCIPS
ncbi:hypothetical protein BU23DRAFT_600048 [Bimuria novae-zelandiae CBS 107.79]|uniref:Uncharacterized protein n=1 Tax=Bimuria novae-zelandiae CBS 107.79 TaxID=1447943 RepID=A0A6A5V9W5_9PLEO|nr:hypothetical protein BU23DRAFT_600048 [Bimuria novae-zelandiae CBS 107.79]